MSDCTELETLLNQSGTTVELDAGRVYVIGPDEVVNVRGVHDLVVVSKGATITQPTLDWRKPKGSHRITSWDTCSHVTWWEPVVLGSKHPDAGYTVQVEDNHAVGVNQCSDFSVVGGRFENVWGDFVYLASNGGAQKVWPSERVSLSYNRGLDCGRHAITSGGVDQLRVVGNTFEGFHRHAIDFEVRVKADEPYVKARAHINEDWRSANVFAKA